MTGPDDKSRTRNGGKGRSGKDAANPAPEDATAGQRPGKETLDLDARRSATGLRETAARRDRLADIRAGAAAARRQREAAEAELFARPAETWADAAAKAEYLLKLFAACPEGRSPERQALIGNALDDLGRLGRAAQARHAAGADAPCPSGETDDGKDEP